MTKNLARILDERPEWFEAEGLQKVTAEVLKKEVFNIKEGEFSLLEERARIVREVGVVIQSEYKGSFMEFMDRGGWDSVRLVRQIAKEFTGFRDEAIF